MTDCKQRCKIARISSLHHGEPEQPNGLENGDEAADDEAHAVEISDAFRGQVERSAEQAREHKHSGHSKDMLQPQDQSLSKGQPVIDTYIERTGVRSYRHRQIRPFETEISKGDYGRDRLLDNLLVFLITRRGPAKNAALNSLARSRRRGRVRFVRNHVCFL